MKTLESLIEEALAPVVFGHVQKAADALGLETYVIGGYVRDTFLDRPRGHDIDIVAVGSGIICNTCDGIRATFSLFKGTTSYTCAKICGSISSNPLANP